MPVPRLDAMTDGRRERVRDRAPRSLLFRCDHCSFPLPSRRDNNVWRDRDGNHVYLCAACDAEVVRRKGSNTGGARP